MSTLWTAEAAVTATGGRTTSDWAATGVSIDSRTLAAGDLFVALAGPSHDGHRFVADAFARGAAAAMVAEGALPGDRADGPLLIVGDTQEGLTALARAARARTSARIVAVTGSVGKTGTKEALALALCRLGPTVATQGNLNNHWGLPLSLARLPADAAYGVFEIGMNHAGEIAPLSRLARPDVAVVTTVGAVHLEHFASEEEIADAKAEIFAGMAATGAAVLNRDNRHYLRLRAQAEAAGVTRIVDFGADPTAQVRLIAESLHASCSAVSATICRQALDYSVSAPGAHWVRNSLAVLAAVRALGGDVVTAAQALCEIKPIAGRGARVRVALGDGRGFTVIDESYNASPMSMRAALEVLAATAPGPNGRRIAVLGDMLELGPQGDALHAALADDLVRLGIDLAFLAGTQMGALAARLRDDRLNTPRQSTPHQSRHHLGGHRPDSASLLPIVTAAVGDGDVVMVKGSLGSRMAPIVAALLARGGDGNGERGERSAATAKSSAKSSSGKNSSGGTRPPRRSRTSRAAVQG